MHDWSQYVQQLPSRREVRAACEAHWRKGAAVAAILFVAIAAVTFALPRKYYSEAKLLVKTGGWENTLDASGSTGQAVSYFEPRENEINSILEVLRCRDVTLGVVDLLGVDALLYRGPIPIAGEPQQAASESARQKAVALLEKQMLIWIPKKSNTIVLRCEAGSSPTPRL